MKKFLVYGNFDKLGFSAPDEIYANTYTEAKKKYARKNGVCSITGLNATRKLDIFD